MQRLHLRPTGRKGFTLIELLVVIAIIAILAAILFPVFAQARAKARQTACLSNEKQIGTGLMLYAQDYDETFPGNSASAGGSGGGADDVSLGFMQPYNAATQQLRSITARDIQPYVKNVAIFVCPTARPRSQNPSSPSPGASNEVSTPGGGNSNYIFNGIVMWRPVAALQTPSNTIFMHEGYDLNRYCSVAPYPTGNAAQSYLDLAAGTYTGLFSQFNWNVWNNYHNGGGNILFCDGHAKWMNKKTIQFAQFGARIGTGTGEVNPPDRVLKGPGDSPSELNEGQNVTMYAAF